MSKPNKFDRLKMLKNEMEIIKNNLGVDSLEYKEIETKYNEIINGMPKYRPHVWRNKGF